MEKKRKIQALVPPQAPGAWRATALPPILLLLAAAVSWLLIDPSGDFPLNDDWAYTSSVRRLLQDGRLVLSDWSSPWALGSIFSGALFARVLGFSHTALRLSTLVWALIGAYFLDKTLKERDVAGASRVLAAGLLFFNPIHFLLSFTFHTDVPFLAMTSATFYFFQKADRTGRHLDELMFSAAAALAALTRQIGILLPLSAAAWLLWQRRLTPARLVRLALLPALAAALFALWFHQVHGPTWASVNYVSEGTWQHAASGLGFVRSAAQRALDALLTASLFCFPFLFLHGSAREKSRFGPDLAAVLIAVGLLVYILNRGLFPYLENIFHRQGLGTLTVYDARPWKPAFLWGENWLWGIYTGLAALSLAVFARRLWGGFRDPDVRLAVVLGAPLAAATLIGAKFFDRYALQWLWILLVVLAFHHRSAPVPKAAWAGLGLWVLVCVAGGWDYFAWNRAKWALGLESARLGVPPEQVANGFDWNAHWRFEANMADLKTRKPLERINEWEWERNQKARAVVSYSPERFRGQGPALQKNYRSPLAPRGGTIFLYRLDR